MKALKLERRPIAREFGSRDEWLQWRRGGIGASESPIIMGLSRHMTAGELFRQKVSAKEEEKISWAIDRGVRLEPVAREEFCAQYKREFGRDEAFLAVNLDHEEIPFMRASLDGLSHDGETLIEIKFQGKAAHEGLLNGRFNLAYLAQIQHQLFVSGASLAWLVSIGDDMKVNAAKVLPDPKRMAIILSRCEEFWSQVQALRQLN